MSVVRISEFQAQNNKAVVLRRLLTKSVQIIGRAPGCLLCELLVSQHDPHLLAIYEVFESVEAHHQAMCRLPREHVLKTFGLLAKPPCGGYYDQVDSTLSHTGPTPVGF